jgi:hypothetical protein
LREVRIKGRFVVAGRAMAKALVTSQPLSFLGGVDPATGRVIEKNHELEGKSLRGKIFVFPMGKGSTVGSYTIYSMAKNGVSPAAIINTETEPIIAAGCVLAGIPLVDRLESDPIKTIRNGDYVIVDSVSGTVTVRKR